MRAILVHLTIFLVFLPRIAIAQHASPETVDKIADWLAVFVIIVVPIVGIAIFLILHILPEKIAEKRHHPQKSAIQTLCFLSLVFGGLLWPLAWLWAFTKPVGYRMAYGTDRHDDFFVDAAAKAKRGELSVDELAHILVDLDDMAAARNLPPKLQRVRAELQTLRVEGTASARDRQGAT
jgi:hypothetical protein